MALTGIKVAGIEWGFLTLTAFLVAFRLFYDYRVCSGRITLSAWFTVGAWIFFCFQTCGDTYLASVGYFEGKISSETTPGPGHFGPGSGLATEADTITALKVLYFEVLFYYSQVYCAKWSMLAFYYSLFPRTMRKLRIALWITIALTIIGFLSNLLLKLFICWPIERNWELGPAHCNTMGAVVSIDVRWTLHVLTDVLVYVLPLIPLSHLKLPTATKVGVALTFAIGFVCIFFACLEQVSVLKNWDSRYIWLLSDFEQTWALIVICCPAFRALLKTRNTGAFSSSRSRHRSTGGSVVRKSMAAGSVLASCTGPGSTPPSTLESSPGSLQKGRAGDRNGITVIHEINLNWNDRSTLGDGKIMEDAHVRDNSSPC